MAKSSTSSTAANKKKQAQSDPAKSWREAVESIVIAIVLAFLFRAFEAEAFVIPTGSMAPTLQGRHKDIECPQCAYQFQAGASLDVEMIDGPVEAVTCPMCLWEEEIDPSRPNDYSHTGDRILVNKFAYEAPFGSPERWDVVVFKYPGNAKQNYIKRLIGLENETIRIRHGDILVRPTDGDADGAFRIARKPPNLIPHMLQMVHDTKFLSEDLRAMKWPSNWLPANGRSTWKVLDQGVAFECEAGAEPSWLNFRKYDITFDTWEALLDVESAENIKPPVVPITDFYAYNAQTRGVPGSVRYRRPDTLGLHWVGDLAVEADVEVQSEQGEILLNLIEAGRSHQCKVDVATGNATLSIDDGRVSFRDAEGNDVATDVTAQTAMRGTGRYRLRFANIDDELLLWVNDRICRFDNATTFMSDPNSRPVTSPQKPGDLQPVRIGARNAKVRVGRLQVLRDIYYIATKGQSQDPMDYPGISPLSVRDHLRSPSRWRKSDLFDRRQRVDFELSSGQFFVLGDNSPYSRDGRMWGQEYYVERDMLIGRAVLIYWPHAWRVGIPGSTTSYPVIPNIGRMGLIH